MILTVCLCTVATGTAQAKKTQHVVPHFALWMCINGNHKFRHDGTSGEANGNWYTTNSNGHYNGLQMSWSWLGIIQGNPNNYTPAQIMQAAETGYKESGYSSSWLQQQWGQTIGPCWQYT